MASAGLAMCPTMTVSTIPMAIQPTSARMRGRASVSMGRICWRMDMACCCPPSGLVSCKVLHGKEIRLDLSCKVFHSKDFAVKSFFGLVYRAARHERDPGGGRGLRSIFTTILIIAGWVELTCHSQLDDYPWVRGLWGLTCVFW